MNQKPLRLAGPYVPPSAIEAFPLDEHGDVFPSVHKHDYDYENPKKFVYRPKGFFFRVKRAFIRFFGLVVGETIVRIRYGLKIVNKRAFKNHKKETEKGLITICNHVFPLDCLAVSASRPGRFPEYPMWQAGFESSLGPMLRAYGGFPVVKTVHGVFQAYKSMREVLTEGKWLHVYPEAACWYNYVPLREFKDGAFRLACQTGAPLFPLVVSFRPRHGLYKLFCRKDPLVTLTIGEPLYAIAGLPKDEATKELLARTHLTMVQMAGIADEGENERLKALYQYR